MEDENTLQIGALILVGCLGMVILAVSIVLFVALYQKKILAQKNLIQADENRHQKELLNATIQVEEMERERVAKNIHDDIGMLLNVAKLHLTKISRNKEDKELCGTLIKESMDLLDNAVENIRGIAKDLMPPTLLKLGFEKGIAELFRQINASGQIHVELTADFTEVRLPQKTEIQLYRITLEMINNIVKHTEATHISLTIRSDKNGVHIKISHNGSGITSEMASQLAKTEKGVGLKSIQSRIQLINASIQYLIKGNTEAEVLIEVPFPTHEENN